MVVVDDTSLPSLGFKEVEEADEKADDAIADKETELTEDGAIVSSASLMSTALVSVTVSSTSGAFFLTTTARASLFMAIASTTSVAGTGSGLAALILVVAAGAGDGVGLGISKLKIPPWRRPSSRSEPSPAASWRSERPARSVLPTAATAAPALPPPPPTSLAPGVSKKMKTTTPADTPTKAALRRVSAHGRDSCSDAVRSPVASSGSLGGALV
mmetsp:Transcript_71954/g.153838  ORF Transcript_71954/g.153838 Transcript_71954/m.153838 type:complete len:214 (+) Transcript_71954:1658-2299(+)